MNSIKAISIQPSLKDSSCSTHGSSLNNSWKLEKIYDGNKFKYNIHSESSFKDLKNESNHLSSFLDNNHVNDTTKNDLKNTNDLKNEIKNDLKTELVNDLNTEIKNDLKTELVNDLKTEIVNDLKNEIKNDLKTELVNDLKTEIKNDLKTELVNDLKTEIKNDLKTELVNDLKNEINSEIRNKITNIYERTIEMEWKDTDLYFLGFRSIPYKNNNELFNLFHGHFIPNNNSIINYISFTILHMGILCINDITFKLWHRSITDNYINCISEHNIILDKNNINRNINIRLNKYIESGHLFFTISINNHYIKWNRLCISYSMGILSDIEIDKKDIDITFELPKEIENESKNNNENKLGLKEIPIFTKKNDIFENINSKQNNIVVNNSNNKISNNNNNPFEELVKSTNNNKNRSSSNSSSKTIKRGPSPVIEYSNTENREMNYLLHFLKNQSS